VNSREREQLVQRTEVRMIFGGFEIKEKQCGKSKVVKG
jgi:hypothetical protein